VSRSHANPATEAFLAKLPVIERIEAGSSLKFCKVAEGLADIYPRFGPTMEWDTAAGDAVLRAAGGSCLMRRGAHCVTEKPKRNSEMDPLLPGVTPRRPFFEHSYFEHSYMDMAIWHSFALKKP